jgi:proline iminopeptidase
MKKNILKFLKWTVLICFIAFVIKGCIPAQPDVIHIHPRTSTQYWNLSTGSKIAYTHIAAQGKKKPYPVIYLHGGPGGYVYTRNIETLGRLSADGYDVYLYDQIGCGLSARLDHVKEYTALRHKKDLEEIVKTLGAQKVILIGQSWGGALAVLYAADHAEQVDRMVFTCPGAIKPANESLEKIKAPASLHLKDPYNPNAKVLPIVLNPRYVSIGVWARFFGKKSASDREADGYLTSMANVFTKGLVHDPAHVLKEEGGAGSYCNFNTSVSYGSLADPRVKLGHNKIPVLVMKGQYDYINWGYTKEYLDLFEHSQLQVITDAGHQIFAEKPDVYVETIKSFLMQ